MEHPFYRDAVVIAIAVLAFKIVGSVGFASDGIWYELGGSAIVVALDGILRLFSSNDFTRRKALMNFGFVALYVVVFIQAHFLPPVSELFKN